VDMCSSWPLRPRGVAPLDNLMSSTIALDRLGVLPAGAVLARQFSARGGVVKVGVCGARVQLGGQAVTGEARDRQFVSNPC